MQTFKPITREFKVSLSDLVLSDGESVATKLSDVQKAVLSIGQELCILRQRKHTMTVDDYEALECRCWRVLDILESL